jgi:predicted phosphodiesterase
MNRTLVIGDIHGGLRALHQIMDRAKVTTDDTLISLGDYVDRRTDLFVILHKKNDSHKLVVF